MVKIEKKVEGNDRVAIIKFKTFDEAQDFYEVLSMASDNPGTITDYDDLDDFYEPLQYDERAVTTAFANSMVIANVITKKPILYLVEDDEWGTYDSITESMEGMCKYYLKEIKDKDSPEFTKIAKQYINAYKKLDK